MDDDDNGQMILIRPSETIYQAHGEIENGSFHGRWHFAFDQYYEKEFTHFGTLRVFNDDTLSPGAVWPLHPHRNIEVVTYCAGGEFRHADEDGKGGILRKGWVQHTTVGKGMWHSEINNSPAEPMRFIQMWFTPDEPNLEPSLQQKEVRPEECSNRLLPLISNSEEGALPIASDASVCSCYLDGSRSVRRDLGPGRGFYLYVTEGGPVDIGEGEVPQYGAARIIGGTSVELTAREYAELLLVEVPLAVNNRPGGS